MCNAHNHPPGCQCGWGGDGHQGGGLGTTLASVSSADRTYAHYQSPMRKLATDLGSSLTFPTTCWYCSSSIYLYAHLNGGFAIFDELGPPWPKHDCRGFTARQHIDHLPRFTASIGTMRILKGSIPILRMTNRSQVDGMVMACENRIESQYLVELFTGTHRITLRSKVKFVVGRFVRVQLLRKTDQFVIRSVLKVLVPDTHVSGSRPQRQIGPGRTNSRIDLGDIATLYHKDTEVSAFLALIRKSLGFNKKFSAVALLTCLLIDYGNRLDAASASICARALFRCLESVRLHVLTPVVWSVLSRRVKEGLDEEIRAVVTAIVRTGELHARRSGSDAVQLGLEDRAKNEVAYMDLDGNELVARSVKDLFRICTTPNTKRHSITSPP